MDASNTDAARMDCPARDAQPVAGRVWDTLTIGNRLSRRTAAILWLMAAIALALYSGWSVIVAAGLSALVLSVLPCAAMCALGLCATGSGKKCASDTKDATGGDR